MAVMIKLKLLREAPTLEDVARLPGIENLAVDAEFGLICIDPQDRLYVVRVDELGDLDERKARSPEIIEAYGDVRISAFSHDSE